MGPFQTTITVIWTLLGGLVTVILWALQSTVNLLMNQLTCIFTKMRKDEVNAQTTINPSEIELFSDITDWWDPNGGMKPLHSMNSVRIPFFRDGLVKGTNKNNDKPLKGMKILDVGCGGGFLSEPLAKLGATVTGIEPSTVLINIAEAHRNCDPELEDNNPTYIATTIEEHIKQFSDYYDVVIASEVIDHTNNPELFATTCIKALKPGGTIFFSTPNRTWLTRLAVVFFCEDVIKIMPKGTHHYENFITPEELSAILEKKRKTNEHTIYLILNDNRRPWISATTRWLSSGGSARLLLQLHQQHMVFHEIVTPYVRYKSH